MSLIRARVARCPKCYSEEVEGYQGRNGDETVCNACGWTSEDVMAFETVRSGVPLLY